LSEGFTQAEYQRRLAEKQQRDQLEQQRIAQQNQPATEVIEQEEREKERIKSGTPVTTTPKQELAISQSLHDVAAQKLETDYKAAARELDVTYRPKDTDKNLFTRLIQKYGHLSGENVQAIRDAKKTLDQQYRSGQMSLSTYQAQINLLKDRFSGVKRLDAEYDSGAVTTFTVTADGKKYTFDNYEDAFKFSVDQQMYPVTYVDSSGVTQTRFFDTPDEATRFINRLEEPGVQTAQKQQEFIDYQATWDNLLKNIPIVSTFRAAERDLSKIGATLDYEAAAAKLRGEDVLAGILYSSGAGLRYVTGYAFGGATIPEFAYYLEKDPWSIVEAAKNDPLVTAANIATLGFGLASAIKGARTAANLKWAATLDDVDFTPTEPYQTFKGTLIEGDYTTNIIQKTKLGFDVPTEIYEGGYETLDFEAMAKFIDENTRLRLGTSKVYGPQLSGVRGPFDVFSRPDFVIYAPELYLEYPTVNPALFESGKYFPSITDEAATLFKKVGKTLDTLDISDIISRQREFDVNADLTLEAQRFAEAELALESAKKMSGPNIPAPTVEVGGGPVVSVLEESTITYPRSNLGVLPNPYYATSRGMVTGGVDLAPPSAEFYAALSALLSSGDAARVSASLEKIDADLKLDISVIPIVTPKIPTDELPDVKAVNLSIPVVESLTEQISEQITEQIQIQEQITEQVTEQTTEQALEEITEQEPILEPVTIIPPPTEMPPEEPEETPPLPLGGEVSGKRLAEKKEEKGAPRFRVVLDGRVSVVEADGFVEALEKVSRGRGSRATITRLSPS